MGKNQSASNLVNIIQYNNGNISFVSGSTTLMQISSSGAITTTGVISGSNALSASYAATASFVTLAQTASFVTTAQTASFVANAQSASNAVAAQTASFANAFTVAGTLTAQTLVVQTITSSVDFVTGSTRFGSLLANTHVFTGSVSITGSLDINSGSFYVGSNNQIGVNTNSPQSQFVVAAKTGNSASVEINLNNAGYGRIFAYNRSAVAAANLVLNDPGGNVGVGTTNPVNGKLEVQTSATTASLWVQTGGTTSGYVVADFRTGTNLSALQILGNGVSSFGGNVGIGTTNPADILHVQKSSTGNFDTYLDNPNTTAGNGVRLVFRTTDSGGSTAVNAGGIRTVFNSRGASTVDNDIIIGTRGGDWLYIKNSGNIGIGTSPSAWASPFTVIQGGSFGQHIGFQSNGPDIKVGSNNYYNGSGYIYTTSNGAAQLNVGGNSGFQFNLAGSGTAGTAVTFTTVMAIASTGAVGINTASPNHRLEVNVNGGNGSSAAIANMFGGSNIANQNCYLYLGNTNTGMSAVVDGNGNPRNNLYAFANGAGVVLNSGATSWTSNSDETVKDIIEPITNAVNKLLDFRTVVYKFKNEEDKRRLGLIAQDVEKEFPEIVSDNYSTYFEKDVKGVAYTELVPVLVKAIQELKAEVDALKAQ